MNATKDTVSVSGVQTAAAVPDNEVVLVSEFIDSIEYIDGSLCVAEGQHPRLPPEIRNEGHEWRIVLTCGRKGTPHVAGEFVNTCNGRYHVFSPTSLKSEQPHDLNFFFGIRVALKLDGYMHHETIYLGQGNRALRNNWWVGGRTVAKAPDLSAGILLVSPSATGEPEQIFSITGGISRLELTAWFDRKFFFPDWLKRLPDSMPVGDISLPGTHDSAAINPWIRTPYACHYRSLSQQLRQGVRLLDIRLSVHERSPGEFDFITCHGDFGDNEYQSFHSALKECDYFLGANPSEFIAMSLKVDDWNGLADDRRQPACQALHDLLQTYPVLATRAMPALRDLRGRIYLLNRINQDLQLGVPIHWGDNTPGSWMRGERNRAFDAYVQDQYKALGVYPNSRKFDLFVQAMAKKEDEMGTGTLLLNFASATNGLLGVYIMKDLIRHLGKVPASGRRKRLGWSLYDYEGTRYSTDRYGEVDVLQMIIASNFNYAGYEDPFAVEMATEDLGPQEDATA